MQSGIILLVMAMCLTPAVDVLSKELSGEHPAFVVAFFRYFAGGMIALFISRLIGQPIQIPKEARLGQALRTGLLVGSMVCLITAFSLVPMAYAVGGFLIAPIVSTLICVVFLGETLSPMRAIGVVLSFLGAVLIARPEAGVEVGTLFALAGGVLLGSYLAATRGSKNTGGALSSLAVQCLFGSALIAPIALYYGLPTLTWELGLNVLGLGIFSAAAHFLTVAAFERADSSVLSPFMYFNLVAAIIVGYVWFNEVPTFVSMMGLLAIGAGGLVALVPGRFGDAIMGNLTNLLKAGMTNQRNVRAVRVN